MKQKFYSLKNILSKGASYNMIFGERSNGKTTAVLEYAIKRYAETGEQMAYLRRWREDFTGKRGEQLFSSIVERGQIQKLTGGEWTNVYYFGSRWYLCRYDENGKRETDETPFCFGFAISAQEHDKSVGFPKVTTVCFDEFLTRTSYLPDEFVLFMNTLSTIIRKRTNVTVFMLGNTVNKYCPYFKEMGLKHVRDMKPGSIDIYRYGDSRLTVAVEYTEPNKAGGDSDFYFAFDNPKLSMITGGAWEIDIYPHLPVKYTPKQILFTYFIEFAGDLLQCEIINTGTSIFTFVHRKTTPLKDPDKDLIYTPEFSEKPNYRRKINRPQTDIEKRIAQFYATDKVFYADNEVGEIVRNYLQWCGKIT